MRRASVNIASAKEASRSASPSKRLAESCRAGQPILAKNARCLRAGTNESIRSKPAVLQVTPGRTATILVVDDDPLIAMSTVDMLEDLGHTVIEAHSAKRALEILEAGQPIDLMMTDQAMPGMTGIELAEIARTKRPDMPVLLATGYADLPGGTRALMP